MISEKSDIALREKIYSARLIGRRLVKFTTALLCLLSLVIQNGYTQTGPGGVGNSASNRLWLKADRGVYRDAGVTPAVNGDQVYQWNDFSGNNNNATQTTPGNRPLFATNIVNNSPALSLDGDAFIDPGAPLGIPGTGSFSIISVFKVNNGYSAGDMTHGNGDYIIDRTTATNELTSLKITNTDKYGFQKRDNGGGGLGGPVSVSNISTSNFTLVDYMREPTPRTFYRLFINGTLESSLADGDGDLTPPEPRIGRHATIANQGLNGYMAEVIIYNYRINNAQVKIINSYLAAKYDLTTSDNRYGYRSTHKYDVAGIGMEDASNFHDNATSAGILNISSPSSLGNGDYLLVGHDNGSVAGWVSTEAPSDIQNLSFQRVAREWRADKTNDVGTVTITGDFANLPALTAGYTIRALLVDSNGDFSSGAVAYPLTSIGGNKYQVTNVTINDGDYLSFAIYKVNNDDKCAAQNLSVNNTCNFQIFSNKGATDSGVADPGNCDGSGASGYSGGDVWFKVTVPLSGRVTINTDTESSSPSNHEWAYRIGIAVYSGTCAALTKINCQISPLSTVPPGNVSLPISGRTPGETLYIRMWEWGNTPNGKFYLCAYDPCLLPPVITGSIAPSTIEGCNIGSAPAAETTVAGLEALGLNITDACTPDASLVVAHLDVPSVNNCPIVVTRTYTIANSSLISSTYDQIINVNDTIRPLITGSLSAITLEGCGIVAAPSPAATVAGLEALPGGIIITDNCTAKASLIVTNTDVVTNPSCPLIIARTYTVKDKCKNPVTVSQIITIEDTQAPVITGGTLADVSVEGCGAGSAPAATNVAELEALPGGITITDACTAKAALSVTHSDNVIGTCPTIITRTYTIEDRCENPLTITHTITVDDTQPPLVTGSLTPSTIVGCSAAAAPPAVTTVAALEAMGGGPAISDACTPDASLNVSHIDVLSGSCPWLITRTYTVTDGCGNSENLVHTISVNDTQPPVVTTVAGSFDATLQCSDAAGIAAALAQSPAATDNCTAAPAIHLVSDVTTPDGTCANAYVRVRIWNFTDGCGNTSLNYKQTITVIDNTKPLVTTPSGSLDATLQCSDAAGIAAALALSPAATDNCTAAPARNLVTDVTTPDGTCSNAYVRVRTWNFIDGCGNSSPDFVQIITVIDNTQPLVTTAAGSLNVTLQCSDAAGIAAALALSPAATDNCTAVPTRNLITDVTTPDATCANAYVRVRTWNFTDGCGNTSLNYIQTITVIDNTQPVVTTAAGSLNATLQCSDAAGIAAALALSPAATDNCTAAPARNLVTDVTTPDATCANAYVRVRTWNFTDGCGNTSPNFAQTVTVIDNTQPVVTTAAGSLDATLQCSDAAGIAVALALAPAATDNCTAVPARNLITDVTTPDATCANAYARVRTWNFSDGCGNISPDFVQTITVIDNIQPVVTTAAGSLDATLQCSDAAGIAAALALSPAATDNCTAAPTRNLVTDVTTPDGTCANAYVRVRTWNFTDGCGNTSPDFVQIIKVIDTTAPVVTGTLSVATIEGCGVGDRPPAVTTVAALEALPGGISIMDNCTAKAGLIVTHKDSVISSPCPVLISRVYKVQDACLNYISIPQTIAIQDTQAPLITGSLTPTTVEGCSVADAPAAETTAAGLEALDGGIIIADGCTPNISLGVTHTDAVSSSCPIVITRTYTVKDGCENPATIVHTIYVNDTQPPLVSGSLSPATIEGCGPAEAPAPETTVAGIESLPGGLTITDACTPKASLTVSSGDVIAGGSCPWVITRTYTVTDTCGNSVNIVHTINISDTQAPVVIGSLTPAIIEGCDLSAAPAAAATVASLEALPGGIAIADACTPDASLTVTSIDVASGSCPWVITRTYTVTDGCGNYVNIIHTITIDDTQPPAVSGTLTDATIEGCDASAAPAAAVTVAALEALAGSIAITDACTPDALLTVNSVDVVNGTCPTVITRTYAVTDRCGNSRNIVHTIFVKDTQAPLITGSLTPATVQGCNAGAAPAAETSVAGLEALPGGLTITDACTVKASLTVSSIDVVAGGSCPWIITRTYTVSDTCGNKSIDFVHTISVIDNTAPVITTAAGLLDATLQCSDPAGIAAALALSPAATDNCTAAPTINIVSDVTTPNATCTNAYVRVRTWNFTDGCGNTSLDFVQTITVIDNTAPVLTTAAGSLDATLQCSDAAGIAAALAQAPAATDNCTAAPTINIVSDVTTPSATCANAFVRVRTWNFSDGCGNTSPDFVQTITVIDNTQPVVTTAAGSLDATLQCSDAAGIAAALAQAPAATDNCTAVPTINIVSDVTTPNATCANAFVRVRTWNFSDGCGNTSPDFVQTITVIDNTQPVVTTAAGSLDATLQCSDAAGIAAALAQAPAATDNCTAVPTINIVSDVTTPNATCANAFVRVRTWNFSDGCGNTSPDFVQTITVIDNTQPIVTTAAGSLDATLQCSDAAGIAAALAQAPAATDNCTAAPTILLVSDVTTPDGTCANAYVRVRTWNFSDGCGNTSPDFVQTITVIDNTQPVVTTAAGSLDATLQCSDAAGIAAALAQAPAATDNCTAVPTINLVSDVTTPNATCANAYVRIRTWNFSDGCGNTSPDFVQTITVIDTTRPVVITLAGSLDATLQCSDAAGIAAALAQAPAATDNCTAVPTINLVSDVTTPNATCANAYVRIRTWNFSDGCGNTSPDFVQTITVIDTTRPVVTTLAGSLDATLQCSDALGIAAAGALTPSATDNCTAVPTINLVSDVTTPNATCANAYVRIRTWNFSDGCGNTSPDFVQTITVIDTTRPVVTTLAGSLDATLQCSDALGIAAAGALTPSATDNCTAVPTINIVSDVTTPSATCANAFVRVRTWNFSDGCGNTSPDFVQTITVIDNTQPVVTTAAGSLDATLQCSDAAGIGAALAQAPAATDNCTAVPTINIVSDVTTPSATCANAFVRVRTWNFSDGCGNTSPDFVQTITVIDNTQPVVTTVAGFLDATLQCSDAAGIAGALAQFPAATDNCTAAPAIHLVSDVTTPDGTCANAYVRVRTWNFTDGCGNMSANFVQTITVIDNTPPSFTAPPDTYVCRSSDCTYDISAAITGDVTDENDNCSVGLNATFTDDISGAADCDKAGVVIRRWALTDACGNSAAFQYQKIYVNPLPSIIVNQSDVLLCHTGGSVDFNVSTTNTMTPGSLWRYDVSVGYPAGVTGKWIGGLAGQTAGSLTDSLTNSTNSVQTVTYTFTPHIRPGDGGAECAGGVVKIVTVDIDPQPTITVNTDNLLCYDGDATFNIGTLITALHPGSQWRYDVQVNYPSGVTGSWAAGLTDQTAASLTDNLTNTTNLVQDVTYTFIPHIKPGDGGPECQNGAQVVVTVSLDPQPKITVNRDKLLCFDGNATFNISTVNTSLYTGSQWRYDVSVVYPAGVTGSWSAGLTNQTSASLTDDLTNTTDVVQTVTYTFTPHIRPGDGGSECDGGVPYTVTVDLDPQPKISALTDNLLCFDGKATFSISTVNTSLYTGSQWRYDVSVLYPAGVTGNWAAGLSNQTAAALTDNLNNTTNVLQTVSYIFKPHIRPGDGDPECGSGVPDTVRVNLDPQPKITVATDSLLCFDGDATFNISTVNTILYPGSLWRYDVSVVYPAGVTGSWAVGLTNQTVVSITDNLTNTTDAVQTVDYTFTPHIMPGDGGSECGSGVTVLRTVSLDPQPKIDVITDALQCHDGKPVFTISTVNMSLHTGSQWRYDVNVIYPPGVTGSWAGGLLNQTAVSQTDNLTNSTNSVQTVTYTFTPHIRPGDGGAECAGGVVKIVTVDIDPQPTITVNTDNLLCYDGDATFNIGTLITALHPGSQWRYDVQVNYPSGVTGSWAAGLTDQTAASLTDNLTNTTNLVQDVTYTFIPHIKPGDGGPECQNGAQVVVTVSLDPQPKITVNRDKLLCFDGNATFNISTVNTSLYTGSQWRYDVSVVYPAGVTGSWSAGLTNQTSASLTDDLTNTTDVVQTVTYTFTPHIRPGDGGSECDGGVPYTVTVDLDPQPKISALTDNLLCFDGKATFSISTVNTSLYTGSQWRYDVSVLYPAGVTGNWAAGLSNQTAAALTDNLNNTTNVLQTVSYIFKPHIRPGDGDPECGSGVPDTVRVNLDPQPRITVIPSDLLLCYDGDALFNLGTVNSVLSPGSQWRYGVSVVYPAGVTGSWGGGLLNQTASTLIDDLTNNTNIVQTVIYTFTPHIKPGDGGEECPNGLFINIPVNLDPRPKITVTTDSLLCYDGDATFNISTVNSKLHTGSQWRYDVSVVYPAGVTGSWAAGLTNQTAGTLTDNLTNTTDIVQTVVYTFTPHIKPGDGGPECPGAPPAIVNVSLDPQPKINVITDALLCYDGNATFNISTLNSALHTGSQWRYDVSVTYPAGVTGSWAAGLKDQTANSLTDDLTNNTNVVQIVDYTFTPHIRPGDGGTECNGGSPFPVRVYLDPQPKITVKTDTLLCFDGNAIFNITTVNSSLYAGSLWRYNVTVNYPAGVTGSWAAGLFDQTAASLTDDLTNTTDIVQTVTYIFTPHIRPGDGGPECSGGVSQTIRVDLDPQPKITVPPVSLLCFDGNAVFNISTVNASLHSGSLWRYDVLPVTYPAGVTGSWPAGLINQTAVVITDDLTNTTDVVQTVTYYFVPHIKPGDGGSECLNGVQVVLNVVIDPQPRLFPVPPDNIQCDSTLTNIILRSPNIFSSGAISFDETVSADGTVTGYPAAPVTGLLNNHLIADRLVNMTDSYRMVTYRIVPVSPAGCASGIPVNIKVTVNPTPRAMPQNPNSRPDSSICFGTNTRVVLTSPTVMTSGSIRFDYTVNVTGGPGVVVGNTTPQSDRIPGYTINYPYQNNSDTLQSVFYNITPKVDNAICVPGPVVHSQITVHAKPFQSLVISTPLTCNGGSDAALHANSSKGAGPYYFDWIRLGTNHIYGYGITDIINIKGGLWQVTVTDNLGCTANPPPAGSIFVAGAFFDEYMYVVDTTGYGTTCPGSNDGELWIKEKSSSTAVGPFEYWLVRDGRDTVSHGFLPTTEFVEKFYNLPVGSYKLYVKDSNGCQNDWNNPPETVITEPPPIVAQFTATQFPGNFNISCKGYNDAFVTAVVNGGNGGYSYKWHTIDGSFSGPDTLDRLDSLTAGTYYLQTTDRKGCVKTDSIRITEPDGMDLSGYGIHDINCYGGNDGFIKLTVTGGSGNYTYSWSGPGSFTATTKDISGLKAGTYSCTILDVNGCILTPKPTFNLIEPPLLTISSLMSSAPDGTHNINCFGGTGSVDITVAGGIPGTYTYEWSTTDGSGLIAGQEDQPALKAGTYHLKVTDMNLCAATADITLTQPAALAMNFIVYDITCQAAGLDDGSINLSVSGGIPAYSYQWSNGALTEDISGLMQGSYRVTVTDLNGCTKTDSARVNPSPPVTYNKTVSDYSGYQITCNGMSDGYIIIEPTEGVQPFTYIWTGPDGFSATTNGVTGLKAGTYTMTITDNNFCTASETFVLTEPGKIGMSVTLSSSIAGGFNINCAGEFSGTIYIEPVNPAGTVDFLWSDGIFGQTRTGLQAGDYRVIISDANNCHADTAITLTQPDSIKITSAILKPLCPDKPDGRISLSVTGGVRGAGYNYSWSDNSTDSTLTNIPAGNYTVTVSDLNLCNVTHEMKVDPQNQMCLQIPEAFSPNGDGVNDLWNIGLVDLYPEIEITIYNRWGESIWRSARGYPVPWDGRSNGRDVPMDSYHYFIDLHNGSRPILGSVTIVR